MSQERDTHFRGAAKLLVEQMYGVHDEQLETLVSQFAYDLVHHALDTSGVYLHPEPLEPEYIADTDEIMKHIPDMTTWTEQSEE